MINEFKSHNPNFDIQNFNFFDKQALKKIKYPKNLKAEDINLLHEKLKAWQRLGRLVGHNEDLIERLYEKGFRSAYQIASMPKHKFIKHTADIFPDFKHIKPEQVYNNALARKVKATLTYTAIAQQTAPHYKISRFNNYQTLTDKNFSGLPSYEDLFGNQNFCNCQDCRSVLSPAAYFVDLMRIQATYLEVDEKTAYPLQSRRGDLWTLELSCSKTNNVIPKLEIVNKVLLSNSGIIQEIQDNNEDQLYEPLDKKSYPFNLPFNLPLTKIRQYLMSAKTSLSDIWQKLSLGEPLDLTKQAIQLDTLGLSPEKWKLLATQVKESDAVTLASYYGLDDIKTKDDLIKKLQDVSTFLAQTGLDRNQLNIILSGDLSSEEIKSGLNNEFFVNATGEQSPVMKISVGGTGEEIIENLTFARLDHLNRFIRLAQVLDWSFVDTDWSIRTASSSNSKEVVLDEKSLPILSFIKRLQESKKELSTNQTCALVKTIKDFGKKATEGKTYFDTIYNNSNVANPPEWKNKEGEYKLEWLVPTISAEDKDKQPQIQSALTSALKISLNDLITIANYMLKEQAVTNGRLLLTLPNLSILYRISQLSSLLSLSINEILVVLALPGSIEGGLKGLFAESGSNFCSMYDWLSSYVHNFKTTKFSTYGLQYALTGFSDNIAIRNQIIGNDSIQNFLADLNQDIKKVLVNKDSFQSALGAIFQQPQYSEDAVNTVYATFVEKQYISNDGNVLKIPDLDMMKAILLSIFPKDSLPDTNLNIINLSNKLISLLEAYLSSKEPLPKLTKEEFFKRSKGYFLSYMQWDGMLDKVWEDLVEEKIINTNGVVVNIVNDYALILKDAFFPNILKDQKATIIELISSYIKGHSDSQQFSLNKQLSALFGVSADTIPTLIVWQGLSIGDLDVTQAKEQVESNNYHASIPLLNGFLRAAQNGATAEEITIVATRLKLLQQYAYLSKQLLLSAVEIDNIRYNPLCYDVIYTKGQQDIIATQFTLKNIFLINCFKRLIQQYNDTQNRWINYINWAQSQSGATPDNKGIATKLSEITGWDIDQVVFLIEYLWNHKKTNRIQKDIPKWGTIEGIYLLQQWMEVNQQLNMDIAALWQIHQLLDMETLPESDKYKQYSSVAAAIWGGLTKRYQSNLSQLSPIKGEIEEQKRTALLNLVLKQLQSKNIPVETARDLYEYLLIDVEVNSAVETSYINEAISAVQLYLHRCRNHLEKGVQVEGDLDDWWDWIESYRVWEANRQVFLYPENYIQPELRKKKTPLFSQLENDLKQLNLQEISSVETAFNKYMDGFAEIANLRFVGVASCAIGSEGMHKEYCFVACTKQAPFTYYYRTAIFSKIIAIPLGKVKPKDDEDNDKTIYYTPTEWGPWSKIDVGINAIGPVQPTFAFGKWFVFWVEQYQSGAKQSATLEGGDSVTEQYSARIKFSYLNLSGGWVPEQTLGEPVQLPQSINTMQFKEYWDRVYPVYFAASQTLMVPYQKSNENSKSNENRPPYTNLVNWNQGGLNKGAVVCIKYAAADSRYADTPLISAINEPSKEPNTDGKLFYQYWHQYYQLKDNNPIPINIPANTLINLTESFTLSTWIKENNLIGNYLSPIAYLCPKSDNNKYTEIYIDQQKQITLQLGKDIVYKTRKIESTTDWHQLTAKYIPALKRLMPEFENIVIYSNELFYHEFQYFSVVVLFNKETNKGAICIQKYVPEQDTPYNQVMEITTQPSAALGGTLITIGNNEKFYFSWQEAPNKVVISEIIFNESGPRLAEPAILSLSVSKSIPDFTVIGEKIYVLWSDENGIINLGQLANFQPGQPVEIIDKIQLKNLKGEPLRGTYPAITASEGKLYIVWVGVNEGKKVVYYCSGTPENNDMSVDPKIIIQDIKYEHAKMISLQSIGNQQFISWINEDAVGLTELNCGTINNNGVNFPVKVPDYKDGNWVNICLVSDEIFLLSGSGARLIYRLSQFQTFLNGEHFETITINPVTSFAFQELFVGFSPAQGVMAWNSLMQEFVLYDRILSNTEINILYQNSKAQVTHNFDLVGIGQKDSSPNFAKMLETSFGDFKNSPDVLYVLDDPNSVTLNSNGIDFLNIFYNNNEKSRYSSNCYRLNTTASNKLAEDMFMIGASSLFTIDTQKSPEIPFDYLKPNTDYVPVKNWPLATIDFNLNSAMSQYYWEIFFHAPFLIANALKNQQQFATSKTWYEYIFNPTINDKYSEVDNGDEDKNDKYWRFLGLRSFNNPTLKTELDKSSWAEEMKDDLSSQPQLKQYHSDPFDPHAIATLRPIAYQKAIVMHYINNTLSWADNLFRQYTVESIMEATMLYVMAYDLLGKQPLILGDCPLPKDQTLDEIIKDLGNIDLKDIPEFLIILEQMQKHVAAIAPKDNPNNYIHGAYFGLPDNEQFIGYWDKVRQALYNIRHGLNIDGVRQQLPLFQPPLNPADLVQQIGSGANLSQALSNQRTQIPYYRFEVIIQKAKALTQTVVQFGQSLLSALEKRDNEQLLLLNHVNQQNILSLTQGLKEAEINVTENTLLSLEASLQNATDRLTHYTDLIEQGLSAGEIAQITMDSLSIYYQTAAQPIKAIAAGLLPIPDIYGLAVGGGDLGGAISQGASALEGTAFALNTASGLAAAKASYERRSEDWQLQKLIAQDDRKQIEYQILAAQYQQEIAKQDLMLLKTNIKQEQEVQRFLISKFTNEQLYQWMVGKLSSLYFCAYQLAYKLALQAEQAWQFEKGIDTQFIKGNYWTSLNHGLVTGEVLQLDLEAMESAYMEQNQRRLEIQKTISLKDLDAKAFANLIKDGSCIFDISQKDFDLDYPGHYCRQIKTVSLSFPVLIGPYQNIHATLAQIANRVLIKADNGAIDYLYGDKDTNAPDSSTLRVNLMANQQIALSQGLNDTGLFVLNFNDERYLPFEGTGAISTWKLEMPHENNKLINMGNLSDVIIQINYTAIPGNQAFASHVKSKAKQGSK